MGDDKLPRHEFPNVGDVSTRDGRGDGVLGDYKVTGENVSQARGELTVDLHDGYLLPCSSILGSMTITRSTPPTSSMGTV